LTDLYLIAHKVRGEPAFDIAIILDVLDEDGDPIWIIPTSGHRAYPAEIWPLYDYFPSYRQWDQSDVANLPDHYACNDRPIRGAPSLLDRLNLKPNLPPIVRRI